jgi:hypothetical protein
MTGPTDAPSRRYDRAHLLGEARRNDVPGSEEAGRHGVDSFGEPAYEATRRDLAIAGFDAGLRNAGDERGLTEISVAAMLAGLGRYPGWDSNPHGPKATAF